MSDLVTFLRERLDEDERSAQEAGGSGSHWASWTHRGHIHGLRDLVTNGQRVAEVPLGPDEHIARHDPAHVLAEVDMKRRIIELHFSDEWGNDPSCPKYGDRGEPVVMEGWVFSGQPEKCKTLMTLAQPYADHDDFDPEWKL